MFPTLEEFGRKGVKLEDQMLTVGWRKGVFLGRIYRVFTKGIHNKSSCKYIPQQNGVAERKNQSIVEAARKMLEEKHLPKQYWAEDVCTAVYLLNRSSTEGAHITPH